MKGGLKKMVREKDEFEEDSEEDLNEDFEEEDFEDEVPVKKKKGKTSVSSVKRTIPEDSKEDKRRWRLMHQPEMFTVINPLTNEIMAQGPTLEDINLQLQVLIAQKSTEAAKGVE